MGHEPSAQAAGTGTQRPASAGAWRPWQDWASELGPSGQASWGHLYALRAALSEVEEYPRVTLRRIDPAHISGSVVAEVAHLLAELIAAASRGQSR